MFIGGLSLILSASCPLSQTSDSMVFITYGTNRLETCQTLNTDLDYAQDWPAVTWSMLFNADKSEWLQITSKTRPYNTMMELQLGAGEGMGNSFPPPNSLFLPVRNLY